MKDELVTENDASWTDTMDKRESGTKYRHAKTGVIYEVLGVAMLEKDLTTMVVYKSTKDGMTWTRPSYEFYDGRFVKIRGYEDE